MNRPRTAAIGIALGFASLSTAAMAMDGDAWYGSSRSSGDYVTIVPQAADSLPPDSVTVYYDEPAYTTPYTEPAIVERDYVARPYDDYVWRHYEDFTTRHNPQTDNRIGRGLFPSKGPNDFGQ